MSRKPPWSLAEIESLTAQWIEHKSARKISVPGRSHVAIKAMLQKLDTRNTYPALIRCKCGERFKPHNSRHMKCKTCAKPKPRSKKAKRICLKCGDDFPSDGIYNRICNGCRDSNANVGPMAEHLFNTRPPI